MSVIQFILVVCLTATIPVYFKQFRTLMRDRIVACALALIAVFFVLFPGRTTAIANIIGVDRGTDLVLYMFIMLFIFASILMYSKITMLEERQVELVRMLAIRDASTPEARQAASEKSEV